MGEVVSRASSSSDGAFVLILKAGPLSRGIRADSSPHSWMILELASVPKRWLNLGSEHRRQDSSFQCCFHA